jgi:hypothetical protein
LEQIKVHRDAKSSYYSNADDYEAAVDSAPVQLPTQQWLEFQITWDDGSLGGAEGDITFTVKNDSGRTLQQISGHNEFFSSGGIGYVNQYAVGYFDRYAVL